MKVFNPNADFQSQLCRAISDDIRPDFNDALFERDNQDIVDAMVNVLQSLDHDKYFTLKMLKYEVIEDYEDVYNELRQYVEDTRKSKKNSKDDVPNPYDYINAKDSDVFLMKVWFYVRKNGTDTIRDGKENRTIENPEQILTILIALPRFVNKYYFRLNGNYYNVLTQIVDASTYNNTNRNSVTFKIIFGPCIMYKSEQTLKDENTKEPVKVMAFSHDTFGKPISTMLVLFAKFGYYGTFQFLGLNGDEVVITDYQLKDPNRYTIKKANMYISVLKGLEMDPVVGSIVVTLHSVIKRTTNIHTVFTNEYWLTTLGSCFRNKSSVECGVSFLDSTESLYDQSTKNNLLIPEEYKQNIYFVLKWMMYNFDWLFEKSNMDVSIKRRRIGEYIAQEYATDVSEKKHRFTDAGKKVSIRKIVTQLSMDPMKLVKKLATASSMNNLITFADTVNDNDAIQALKFTFKGISGLGEGPNGKVQNEYRFIDPSALGIIDLDAIPGDPGMSGILCPMTKTYGDHNEYFTEFEEPNHEAERVEGIRHQYELAKSVGNVPLVDIWEGTTPPTEPNYATDFDFIQQDYVDEIIGVSAPIDLDAVDTTIDFRHSSIKEERERLGNIFAPKGDEADG